MLLLFGHHLHNHHQDQVEANLLFLGASSPSLARSGEGEWLPTPLSLAWAFSLLSVSPTSIKTYARDNTSYMLVMDQNLERQDSSMIITFLLFTRLTITFLLLPPSSSFLLVSPWSLEVTARDSFEPDSCPESPLVRELKTEVKVINLNESFD